MTNQKLELSMLEKCGILMIVLVAKENMPFSPKKFQGVIGALQKDTSLTDTELWEVYEYLQKESIEMAKPKNRSALGFKNR